MHDIKKNFLLIKTGTFIFSSTYAIVTVLVWFPLCLQLSLFSLLYLFYADLVSNVVRKSIPKGLYLLFNITFLVLIVRWCIIGGIAHDYDNYDETWEDDNLITNASAFFCLSFLQLYFGIQLLYLKKRTPRLLIFDRNSIAVINIVISLIFASRSVHNILSTLDLLDDDFTLQISPEYSEGNTSYFTHMKKVD